MTFKTFLTIRNSSKYYRYFTTAILVLSSIWQTNGTITLPSLISDNMILQQDKPVHIWGKANVGEKIIVSILDQTQMAVANDNGNWQLWLHPMNASESVTMTISGENSITVNNILIGEVWFASGQSNMEWSVKKSNNSEEEISNANYPQIRFFDANRNFSDKEQYDIEGEWVLCSPETVGEITGAGYFFSRGIHNQLKAPIGLIDASWGATRCEAWTPSKVFDADPRINYWPKKWKDYQRDFPKHMNKYKSDLAKWEVRVKETNATGENAPKKPREPKQKNKNQPSSIYNGVVAPISQYTIRGIIWYQGENNAYKEEAYIYRYIFPEMIEAWREAWNQGCFPFIYAQLSILHKHQYWPVLRESQTEALKLKNTAMITTYDVGDSTDAHFKNKQAVGKRLELAARKLVYGEDIEASGPVFRQMTIEGDSLRIWFDYAKGLKPSNGDELVGFEIADESGMLVPANAKIDGETIVIYNIKIKNPKIARYAFKDVAIGNLVNGAELPAVPFRIDVRKTL